MLVLSCTCEIKKENHIINEIIRTGIIYEEKNILFVHSVVFSSLLNIVAAETLLTPTITRDDADQFFLQPNCYLWIKWQTFFPPDMLLKTTILPDNLLIPLWKRMN